MLISLTSPSATLSGNRAHAVKNTSGKDDGNHSAIYTSHAIQTHPSVQLTRGGLILIGLLSGGDYHQAGLPRCGPGIAHGLARCGFGDQLLEATRSLSRDDLPAFLKSWRKALREELSTNASGYFGTRKLALAKSVPEDFPNIDILLSYTNPITSETDASARRTHVPPTWARELDLSKIAHLCEIHFEWGLKDIIIKRFRTVLWPSAVLRILRRAALDADQRQHQHSTPQKESTRRNIEGPGTPSKMLARHFSSMALERDAEDVTAEPDEEEQLIVKVHSARMHAYTGGILEYRLEVAPAQLVRLCTMGIQGIRKPADTTYDVTLSDEEFDEELDGDIGRKKKGPAALPPEPDSHLRVWVPACMVRIVRPDLAEEFEAKEGKKKAKKTSGARKMTTGAKAKKSGNKELAQVEETLEYEDFDLRVSTCSEDDDGAPVLKPAKKSTKKQVAKASSQDPPNITNFFRAEKAVPSAPAAKLLKSRKPDSSAPSKSRFTKSKRDHNIQLYDRSSEDKAGVRPSKAPSNEPSNASLVPSTSKASQTSILDMLDNLKPRTIALPPSTPSSSSIPLRPFPTFDMDNDYSSSDDDCLPPPPPFPIPISRQPSQSSSWTGACSSSSETSVGPSGIRKSPRRSSDHTSPRKNTSSRNTPVGAQYTRTPSPSPFRQHSASALSMSATTVTMTTTTVIPLMQRRVKVGDESIIEISSGSEGDTSAAAATPPLPPLLRARARAAKQQGNTSPTLRVFTKEVIDLT